jgi:hypothetical protein
VTQRTTTTPVALDARRLAGDVLLLVWNSDEAPSRGLRATIGGALIPPPASHNAIPLGSGRVRNLLAVRLGADQAGAGSLAVCDASGATIAEADSRSYTRARPQDLDPAGLLVGLEGVARVRAVRFLADVCGSVFQLGNNADFIANCRQLLGEISRRPGELAPRCKVLDRHVLFSGVVKPSIGERLTAIIVSANGVRRATHAPVLLREVPARQGLATFAVLLDKASLGGTLVLLGENGLACRQITDSLPAVSALDWLLGAARDVSPLRRYLLDCLAKLAADDEPAVSLLRELQVLSPERGRVVNREACPVAAGADLMLATNAGLFVSGWLRDPHGVVDTIEVQQADRTHGIALDGLLRFPHREADQRRAVAPTDIYSGFAAFVPAADRKDASCQLTVRLRSGEKVAVADGPTFLSPDAALPALLAAIPADSVPAETAASCLEAAIAALRAQHVRGEPTLVDIGTMPEEPVASVIVPLSGAADLLRCRFGLFATDPMMKHVEIIHVLDRAQQRTGGERLLRALHAAYGVPTRLVIVDDAPGSGAALNAAARAAQAPVLAVLGADTLPEQGGWLQGLLEFLDAHPRCGAAGPRLLREDCSLASAGIDFAADDDGRWDATPLLRGFPSDFAAATAAARIGALALGCIVMRRSVFEMVGGFAEDYLDPIRQAADLGARVNARGFEVWRAATPALFDFAADRASPIVAEIDRRLLAQRWQAQTAKQPAQAEEPSAEPKTRGRNRRRRRAA